MDLIGGFFLALFLVLLNGFFVAAEFAFVKVRRTQLDVYAENGNYLAKTAQKCLDDLDAYLSATQLGITFASLGLGWISENMINQPLNKMLDSMGFAETLPTGAISLAIGFGIISFMHIVVGEVAPKSLALIKPVKISMAVAPLMRLSYYSFYPALMVLNASSNFLLKMFKVDSVQGHATAVSSEELRKIAADAVSGGMISKGQGKLFDNIFSFTKRVTHEIMVPRNRVVSIDIKAPIDELMLKLFPPQKKDDSKPESEQEKVQQRHTRFPLYDENLDNIVGILHLKDLIPLLKNDEPIELKDISRKAHFIPETMPAHQLLNEFQRLRSHMVIVVDEYGSVAGLVTLEDTLEEIVGEIQDEFDHNERLPLEEIDDGYSIAGNYLFDDLISHLELKEVSSESDTVSGYLMERLGRIPTEDDCIELSGGWNLKVISMFRRRVERLHVIKDPDFKDEAEDAGSA